MNVLSYRGEAAVKERTLERLRAAEKAGNFLARSVSWSGNKGSLVGVLLQGEDLGTWQDAMGLPTWLALALDDILVRAAVQDEGVRRGIELMNAIPVGVDLQSAGSRYVVELLEGEEHGLITLGPTAKLRDMLGTISALHRRRLAGEVVTPEQWRQRRREAVALANSMPKNSLDAAIAASVEAAAWDPATSRTVVTDTLHAWTQAMMLVAEERKERWTGPERERVQELLRQCYEEARTALADDSMHMHIDVFKELEKKYPAEWKLVQADIRRDRAQTAAQAALIWRRASDLLEQSILMCCDRSVALIPRAHLFANPARAGIAISPDGQWLAWLADSGGVMNLWAASAHAPYAGRQLTFDRHRGLQGFSWTYVPGLLLYSQDRDGDENWRIFGVDAANGVTRELSPSQSGVRASIQSISRVRRTEALITLNQRDPRYPDLYVLDLESGHLALLEENPGFSGFLADDHYCVRLAGRSTASGGSELLRRDTDGQWAVWISLSEEDARNSGPTHFSADGKVLYFRDSRERDKAALTAIDIESGQSTVLAEDSRADIGGVLDDPNDYRPLAYGVLYERFKLHVLDDSIREDIDFLDAQDVGEWSRSGRTEDDKLWLINASSDVRPGAAYLYDRTKSTLTKLLDVRPQLAHASLARMQSTTIETRDGLRMVSYLTLPVGKDHGELHSSVPVPLVLMVHGGPWMRDGFGYNSMHQWLANRGYAVLSVNFRGSTGFGKSYIVAADGEWGRKMDEDLEDAVQWALDKGIADPERLAIFGASYGGYAVLSALTRSPNRYACGIDIVGPSNLETLLASIPPYWEAARAMQYRAIGNPETEEGRALLRERSPLHRAAAVRSPLLIAQGANDPRVKQAEAEQMVAALKRNGIPVTYALYPDEGHGFVREANRMSFNALCESFLARHLGGREEPWSQGDFPGTTLEIVEDDERREA